MAEQQIKKQNPLSQWFRQPKVYIKLPSNGEFYPHGALDKSANGEYPVYAMNAKDELMFKTPDALLTGQSTVEVIKSCIPAIQDPWSMPSIDLDVALVAIRIATYGQNMEVTANCPHCKNENSYDVDLVAWLGTIGNFEYHTEVNCDPLMVHVRPYSYQELSKTNIKNKVQAVNKNGKLRKTKAGDGKTLSSIIGVAVSQEMTSYIAEKCIELNVKKADFIRDLIEDSMKKDKQKNLTRTVTMDIFI